MTGPLPDPLATTDWVPRFIARLRVDGNVGAAAAAAGVKRRTALDGRATWPEFRAEWDQAIAEAVDRLEAEAWRRAMAGSDNLLWKLLSALRRDTFGERVVVEVEVRKKAEELAKQLKLSPEEVLAEVEAILAGEGAIAG